MNISSPPHPLRTELQAMLALAAPLIATNITYVLVNTTDVLLLGHVGPRALAASAIGAGIVIATMLIGIGLLTACTPLIAEERGRKKHSVREVRRTVRQGLWIALLFSMPACFGLWFTGDAMRGAGQAAQLSADVETYVHALEWQLPAVFIMNVFRNFMAALERPLWSMIISMAAVLANGLINWALIFGHLGAPRLGLWGAGIGTTLVSLLVLAAMVAAVSLLRPFRRYHLFGRFWRVDWQRFRDIWRIGLPIALQMGFEASVFAFAVFLMGYFGAASVAAHAIALQIASMTFMVPMGVAQAATVRVGLGYGSGDAASITRAGKAAYLLGVGFMTFTALILALFPSQLASLFLEPSRENMAVMALAVPFIRMAALFQIADGAQVVGAGLLRGLQDTRMPMLFAGIGYWGIGIGFGAWLAFRQGWGGLGIWMGLATGLGIVALLMLVRWIMRGQLGKQTERV